MQVTIRVDGEKIETQTDKNLSEVLQENNIKLPDLAYQLPNSQIIHTDLVEDVVDKIVKRATDITIQEKTRVNVHSGLARQHRQAVFRMIYDDCQLNCDHNKNNDSQINCETCSQIEQYLADDLPTQVNKIEFPIHRMAQAAEIDVAVCTGCNNCVEACDRVGINYLSLDGEGEIKYAVPSQDEKVDCIYCGQCTVNCPVKSAREQSQVQQIENYLADKELITVVQMAPSVRTSIGEEFDVEVGTNLEKQMFTAFRELGFSYVFDVNMGADITTFVEAAELVGRLNNQGQLPMFTSCCPAWVKFIEFYYPEMIPHLTEARSPQIHSGVAYKTWWAQKNNIDPKKIRVISVMPCTSKQYEARQKRLMVDDLYPVDCTLTTREMAYLLKKNKIDLPSLPPGELDDVGQYSGAGAIYGASGGVMESALRTACYMLSGKDLPKLEFEQVRGMAGIKKAEVEVAGQILKVAVAATAVNFHKLVKEVKENPKSYHYIEFMACPGGCIGGGGQPIPASDEKTAKRIESLYKIDTEMKMRQAHQNPVVNEFVNYVQQQPQERQKQLLYREFEPKQKGE
jgi:iron-only hydrogenase group A